MKGPPLTCVLCKGVLILNAEGLRMHLKSKRHMKQQKRLEDPEQDTIVYAEDLQEDSSGSCLALCRLMSCSSDPFQRPCMPLAKYKTASRDQIHL